MERMGMRMAMRQVLSAFRAPTKARRPMRSCITCVCLHLDLHLHIRAEVDQKGSLGMLVKSSQVKTSRVQGHYQS
jgi:hypothetical protein